MGDIGEPKRVIELEPFPEHAPVQEPTIPVPLPPVREPEEVPA